MKYDCDVIRDLLPLYADGACSEKSGAMVEEHLRECPACRGMADVLRKTELENTLRLEKDSVIEYGVRQFRRRSALVGSAVSGAITLPVLACLALVVFKGPSVSWVGIVMAGIITAASLIVVPLTVREDRAFWTFCAFTASLILLLGVICLYTGGDWFRIAAGAVLLGLSVIFLPFLVKARPVRNLIGGGNRVLLILGVDAALLFNLLNALDSRGRFTLTGLLFTIGAIGGIVCVAYAVLKNRKQPNDGDRAHRDE